MNKVFRSIVLIALSALMLFCLASCSSGGKDDGSGKPDDQPKAAKSMDEIYQDVYAVSGFGEMTRVPKRDYVEIYGIDTNKFIEDEYFWYTSENYSLNADEVAVFHVKDDYYVSVLESLLQKHLDLRLNVAVDYSPEEAAKLERAQVTSVKTDTGNWVYLCVGDNYTQMMDVLKADIG